MLSKKLVFVFWKEWIVYWFPKLLQLVLCNIKYIQNFTVDRCPSQGHPDVDVKKEISHHWWFCLDRHFEGSFTNEELEVGYRSWRKGKEDGMSLKRTWMSGLFMGDRARRIRFGGPWYVWFSILMGVKVKEVPYNIGSSLWWSPLSWHLCLDWILIQAEVSRHWSAACSRWSR